jgi:hypothetical protein
MNQIIYVCSFTSRKDISPVAWIIPEYTVPSRTGRKDMRVLSFYRASVPDGTLFSVIVTPGTEASINLSAVAH